MLIVVVFGKGSNNASFSMSITEYRIPGTVCPLYKHIKYFYSSSF